MLIFIDTMQTHNKNINDRQQSWLDAQKAARPLYWRVCQAWHLTSRVKVLIPGIRRAEG